MDHASILQNLPQSAAELHDPHHWRVRDTARTKDEHCSIGRSRGEGDLEEGEGGCKEREVPEGEGGRRGCCWGSVSRRGSREGEEGASLSVAVEGEGVVSGGMRGEGHHSAQSQKHDCTRNPKLMYLYSKIIIGPRLGLLGPDIFGGKHYSVPVSRKFLMEADGFRQPTPPKIDSFLKFALK